MVQQITEDSSRFDALKDSFNSLQLRLDPTNSIELLHHQLLNEYFDPKERVWKALPGTKPYMSHEGVHDLMAELYGRMAVDKVLGNLKESEYKTIIRDCGNSILSFLWHNTETYQIDDKNFRRIFYLVLHNVQIFLSRPVDGQENKLLAKQFGYNEITRKTATSDDDTSNTSKSWGIK